MNNLHNNFNQAMDLIIESKLKIYEENFSEKINQLER